MQNSWCVLVDVLVDLVVELVVDLVFDVQRTKDANAQLQMDTKRLQEEVEAAKPKRPRRASKGAKGGRRTAGAASSTALQDRSPTFLILVAQPSTPS